MSTLRDTLQITRINRIKRRIAEHWQRAHCGCPMCTARRSGASVREVVISGGADPLGAIVRALRGDIDDEAPTMLAADAPKH